MAVGAHQAVNEVLFSYLNGASTIWGTRVQPLSEAGSTLVRPYVVFFNAAGGRALSVPSRDHARFTISVKCVALGMAAALGAQEVISGLLHNSGRQDIDPRLPIHADWDVLTVTEGREIWIEDKFEGAQRIYHAGHQYEILMERK